MSAVTTLRPAAELITVPGFEIQAGGRLPSVDVGFEDRGAPELPPILVLGGISASAHVSSSARDPSPGWWEEVATEGGGIDPGRFRVLSVDFLGGGGATTGPRSWSSWNASRTGTSSGERFPAVTPFDQAELIVRLLDALGVPSLRAAVGASYGGMVVLSLAERFPDRVQEIVVVSAPAESDAWSTAWRALQRAVLELGRDGGQEGRALALARSLAMLGYRGRDELRERFVIPAPDWDLWLRRHHRERSPRSPAERYLRARGRAFCRDFAADAYQVLSRSLDLHRVDPRRIPIAATVAGCESDLLVPWSDVARLGGLLPRLKRLVKIESSFGHDAFLKETEAVNALLREALEDGP